MKLALVVLAAVLLLAGCGHAKDPFVGTWRVQTNAGTIFVISKHDSGYLVVAADSGTDSSFEGALAGADPTYKGVGVLDAQGDTLIVNFAISTGPPAQIETIRLTVRPHTRLQAAEKMTAGQGLGYLGFVMAFTGGMPATLVKVSNCTAAPTPSP
jgi:hypothetical protein